MRAFALFLAAAALAGAQSVQIRLVRVASGFSSALSVATHPLPGQLYITEQRGRVRILRNGQILSTPFLDWTQHISCCDERGLLGLAFPPGYPNNRNFYIYYTDPQGAVTISRLKLSGNPDVADPASEEVLLKIAHPMSNHNGGNLVFGPDGYLYIGTGDGGGAGDPQRNGQNLNTLLGKLLRIDPESGTVPYGIPPSNPFISRQGARAEIWAWGLRNPWKFSFDRETRDLYIADVGQNSVEEVDFQPASSTGGENYGWNRTEGSSCYSPSTGCDREGITFPVAEYTHALGNSITGGYVYRGSAIPALRGAYLYGDYGSGRIWMLRNQSPGGWQAQEILKTSFLISSFGQDLAGEIYVVDYKNGDIYRVTSPAGTLTAVNAASFGEGLTPGSLGTIFGSGIAPVVGVVQATAFPLPTDLGGVSVTLNGTKVPLLAVANANGQDQISFQIPYELAGQSKATMVVTVNGQATAPAEIPLTPAQPEIFVVQQQPAAWTIWATGLGPVSNAPATGQPAPASPLARTLNDVQVTIGGMDAPVFYAGLSPNFAGLYQINVTPPPGVSPNAEVVIKTMGAVSRPWRPTAP